MLPVGVSGARWSVCFYVLLGYTLSLLIPVTFQQTMPYLDASWGFGLNYFLHSRYVFGPDLIFTYGPLGFLNNPQHVGHDIEIALVVHLVFWVALAMQLLSVWRLRNYFCATLLCLSLLVSHQLYHDYWDYYLLAIAAITVAKLFRHPPSSLDLALLPVLCALAFLLKFVVFLVVILLLAAYLTHLVLSKCCSRFMAGWFVFTSLAGPLAYLLYEPSLKALALYLKGSLQVATGYASAMSIEGDPATLHLAELAVTSLLLSIAICLWGNRLFYLEAGVAILLLWNSFRHGFVRADTSHSAMFFGFSTLVSALILIGRPKAVSVNWSDGFLLLSTCAIAVCSVDGLSIRYRLAAPSYWWPTQAFTDFRTLLSQNRWDNYLDHGFDSAFEALPGMAFRNSIAGHRVLIYPNGTPYVAKVSFEMFPLYALQDYAATTPFLDRRSALNLRDANPQVDKVILEWEAIDQRNLFLDTPEMSTTLLSDFEPEAAAPGALLLKHRPKAFAVGLSPISRQAFLPDSWVAIPLKQDLVSMSIKLKETAFGTFFTSSYRQQAVYLELQTASGETRRFRVPPRNLVTPTLINYVPRSIDEWHKLWMPQPLVDRIVKLRLTGPGLQWTVSDGYHFFKLQIGTQDAARF